ncbi:neutral zinc metallopeptidase [Luteococcus sp. Sow4_B9]|uniref:neutral zinc metallopeptidase n=1 Tax=Luteococcus sp. Sow4_B9 TaxID=3438792 RepID=UPI003F9705FF
MTQNPWGDQRRNPWAPPQGSPWGDPRASRGSANPWGPPDPRGRAVPRGGQQGTSLDPWGRPTGQFSGSPWPAQQGPGRGQIVFGAPPPRRRRNPLVTLFKALILLAVLGFLGLILLGWLLSQVVTDLPAPAPAPFPTSQTSSPAGEGAGSSAQPAPRASTPPGTYQNDDYVVPPVSRNPPPLPEPETYEEATQLLEANPLYSTQVPRPVRCEMQEIDVANASRAELTGHLNEMMGCLMRVWEGPLSQSGFQAVRPSVTVYSNPVTTKCGKLPMQNAVYCGADQQVYYAQDLPRVIPRDLRNSRFITESVVAHEFGHAVQARSAILVSELAWEEKSNKSKELQLSRRLEVQADCMAGLFLGSIQQSTSMSDQELQNVGKLFYSIGDDVLTGRAGYEGNHGSGESRLAWTRTGLDSTSVGACNTFAAPASKVR